MLLAACLGSNLTGPLSHGIISGGNDGSNTGEDFGVCAGRMSDIQANDHGVLCCAKEACVGRLQELIGSSHLKIDLHGVVAQILFIGFCEL